MFWLFRYRATQHLRTNILAIPMLGAFVAFPLERATLELQGPLGAMPWLGFSEGTAVALLAAVVGAVISLLGIVLAFLTLLLQSAMGQLSPRVLPLLQDDMRLKVTLGLLVGTFTYGCLVLAKLHSGFVPQASIAFCAVLALMSVILFLAYLQHVLKSLRPAAVAERVVRVGVKSAARAHPQDDRELSPDEVDALLLGRAAPKQMIRYSGPSSTVQAFHRRGLLAESTRAGGLLVLGIAVGDYVFPGAALAVLSGMEGPIHARRLRACVATGIDRQLVGTPAFALRLLVDIAVRALSPDVNDPSTAVEVLNRIEYLLRELWCRPLGPNLLRDGKGSPRVLIPRPSWDEYLHLALTEIRQFGRDSVQVKRRLHALLDDLLEEASPSRKTALMLQRSLLNGSPEGAEEELHFLGQADRQGIGPASRAPQP
jgi:uncharacterized membrane protein